MVISNRSSHWGQAGAFSAELSAVLDGADVSERERAAIAHALAEPADLAAYIEALTTRYATDRDRRSGPPLPFTAPGPIRWTLHLTYLARDLAEARDQAVIYTEGLTTLRPELSANAAVLSRADAWNHIQPVFCGRLGPDDEVCQDVAGHPGFHRAAGLGGLCWGDGDDDRGGER